MLAAKPIPPISTERSRFGNAFLAIAMALLWAGCAHTRPTAPNRPPLPEQFPNHTVSQILRNLVAGTDTLDSFTARASMSVSSPERSGSFSADLRARSGDSLYLSISPGLGIEVARALVTPDSVYLYDRIHNELRFGGLDQVQGALGLPLGEGDLFRNLLGIIFPDLAVTWTVQADDSLYYLTDPTGLLQFTVDPRLWRVLDYQEHAPDGALVEERSFSEFDVFGGLYLPRRIRFSRPADDASATLYYRSLEINPATLSFDLRASATARRNPL